MTADSDAAKSSTGDAPSELTFGCVPHTDDEQTRRNLRDVCRWLAKELDVPVNAHRATSPAELASAFAADRVQIAWVSPALLLTAEDMAKAVPVVCSVRSNLATYHGVLFVSETASYRSPTELRGARAAWVAPSSAAGYIVPRLALASHGLDPRTLFSSEMFCDSHGAVARAVLQGKADVGATYAVFERGDACGELLRAGYIDVVPGERGRIIYAAGPIPSDPIVVAPSVPPSLRARLISALSSASEADEDFRTALQHVLGAEHFEAIRPRSFDPLREQIADARQLGLLD